MDNPVDRVAFRSVSELRDRFLAADIPVVVEGYVESWPAMGKVTPEFLADEWGDHEVPVVTMRDGDYVNGELSDMPLKEYLASIGALSGGSVAELDPGVTRYMAQVPVDKYLPELLDEMERPPFFAQEKHLSTVTYVGGELFSQLHYHPTGSAALCMLHGEKQVRLFAPDQSRYLSPYPWYSHVPHISRTRHRDPDVDEFPDFAQAKYLEVTLSAGDMLFIPIYWWHSITNEGTSVSVVSFWSRTWLSRFVPPAGARAPYFFRPVRKVVDLVQGWIKKD